MTKDEALLQIQAIPAKIWEQLSDSDNEAIEMAFKALKGSDWILSSEKMPEDRQNVLVWFEYFKYGEYNGLYQTYGIGWAWRGEWSGFVNGQSGWHKLRVIAWQPLPEKYKPEV